MRPLRIVFDASPLLVNKTGVAYYTERLIMGLAAQYPEQVELIGFYYNFLGKRSITHFPQAPNIRYKAVRFIPSKVLYQLRRWGIECPVEILSKTAADFILYPNFLSYPSLRRTPSAPVIHDLTYLDLPEYVADKNQRDLERFVPVAVRRSSFIITVSEFSKQKIAGIYHQSTDRILVTPIPAEPPRTFTDREESSVLLHGGIHKPFILYLSTIEPRKNLPSILEAYTKLPATIRNTHTMVVAGRIGWKSNAEENKIRDLRRQGFDIKYLGYVDELMRAVLFKNAVLYVNASGYEGFGMPLLEAMSYGTPVAASDIPVFHEVAGTAASYFNYQDVDAIAECIENLITDEARRNQLSEQGKKTAASFTQEAIAASVYKKILRAVEK